MSVRLAAPGFFCAFSIMASVGDLAETEVKALARLASTVCGPALSARTKALSTPARSTTAALTLALGLAGGDAGRGQLLRASAVEILLSVSTAAWAMPAARVEARASAASGIGSCLRPFYDV